MTTDPPTELQKAATAPSLRQRQRQHFFDAFAKSLLERVLDDEPDPCGPIYGYRSCEELARDLNDVLSLPRAARPAALCSAAKVHDLDTHVVERLEQHHG